MNTLAENHKKNKQN